MNVFVENFDKNASMPTWQTFYRAIPEETMITSDARYESESIHAHAPVLITLSLSRKHGFTSVHQALSLELLEEVFAVWADELRRGHFVGKKTLPWKRELYAYIESSDGAEREIMERLAAFIDDYQITCHLTEECEWQTYFTILCPSDDELRHTADRFILEDMRLRWDDLSRERAIRHWAYFEQKSQAHSFRDYILSDGFDVGALIHDPTRVGEEWEIEFVRRDPMAGRAFERLTDRLSRSASLYGGHYDGWEAEDLGRIKETMN